MYDTIIADRFAEYDIITGVKQPEEPSLINFKNIEYAISIITKHIHNKSKISIHADVDMDGIGSAYICNTILNDLGCVGKIRACINKDKEHGVHERHINYINNMAQCNLLIIVDSGSNDIDIIKQFKCDVVVIDHHVVGHNELIGTTQGGNYVIINNMIDNMECGYKADQDMSGGLVVYELFRHIEKLYYNDSILKKRMLYQWVGATLVSDAIKTGNERNQWYMSNTVHNLDVEPNLKIMLKKLNRFETTLSKSFIGFTLAPIFNKAIRAGASNEALAIALGYPDRIEELKKYGEIQEKAMENALYNVEEVGDICIKPLDIDGIHKNYSGLVATKIVDAYKKSTIAYRNSGDIIEGSFRGFINNIDYRKEFEKLGYFAQGHETAFGVKCKRDDLFSVSEFVHRLEEKYVYKPYITLFGIREDLKGVHHVEDFNAFKKEGWLWKIGMANSVLSTSEQILITTSVDNLVLTKTEAKYRKYSIDTLECMAFEDMNTQFVNIYLEYGNELRAYVRKETNIK